MKKIIGFMALFLIFGILLSGCGSSDTKYESPEKVEAAEEPVSPPVTETPSGPAAPAEEPEPEPVVQIFQVGETATDGELKITVNAVEFVSVIDEQDNQFLVAEAPEGEEYLVIDLTVENVLPDEEQTVSTMLSTEVFDQDGYTYSLTFTGQSALDKAFDDGGILPGMKRRGDLAFLVPADATELKFMFEFDVFTGTTAVYEVK